MLKRKESPTDTAFLLTITISLFIVIYILSIIFLGDKGFSKIQMFFNLFNENAALIVIACGLSIVMITGSIDISVGGSTALICTSCIVCLNNYGFNFFTALILALVIGLTFGAVQGFMIAYLEMQPFIVTLAGMFLGRGLVALIEVNQIQVDNPSFELLSGARIQIPFLGDINKRGVFIQSKLEYGVVIAIIVVCVMFWLLRKTNLGRSFYAVGGNSQSALMLGINVKKTRFNAHLLCGLLAGIGGFLYLFHTRSGSVQQATGLEMDAISASIIGGTLLTGGVGNIFGTLFGVLTSGIVLLIVTAIGSQDPWWPQITRAAMLCFFIVLQSIICSRKRK
ncbi:MAG: sugar ABC transporter permease YjfF [Clostridiales bacterium]|jgi:simple sugar transport system permease protein|nr:sugar ABC transporter permease YjfF [Clostridiales bacterium]